MCWKRRDAVISLLVAAIALLAGGTAHAQADLRPGSLFSSQGFEEQDGESIYRNICQGCHMADARGATGAGTYPALAGDRRLSDRLFPAIMVIKGSRAMPGFDEDLSDDQIAEVVNYVRTHFGNDYRDRLLAAEVKTLRR